MIIRVLYQACVATPKTPLVAGTAGVRIAEFQFSSSWDELEKLAVFQSSNGVSRVMEIIDNKCEVPWDVLAKAGTLKVGVVGVRNGVRLPTIWSQTLRVLPSPIPETGLTGGYTKSYLEAALESVRAVMARVMQGSMDAAVAVQECRDILDRLLGAIYTPQIDEDGVLSWTNTAELPNPDPVKIVGEGVPVGGTTGQVLAKDSDADYDTHWIDPPSGAMVVHVYVGDESFDQITADHTPREVVEAVDADIPVFFCVVPADPVAPDIEIFDYFPVSDAYYYDSDGTYRVGADVFTRVERGDGLSVINYASLHGLETTPTPGASDGWSWVNSTSYALPDPFDEDAWYQLTPGLVPMTVENYGDINWNLVDIASQLLPAGGTSGQVLAKNSNTDHDVHWVNPPSGALFVTLTSSYEPSEPTSIISEVTIPAADWTYESEADPPSYFATVSADDLIGNPDFADYNFIVYMDGAKYSGLSLVGDLGNTIGDPTLFSFYPFAITTYIGENDELLATINTATPGPHTFSVITFDPDSVEFGWTADHTIAEIAEAFQSGTPVYIGVRGEGEVEVYSPIVPVSNAFSVEDYGFCAANEIMYIDYGSDAVIISYANIYGETYGDGDMWEVNEYPAYAMPNAYDAGLADGSIMVTQYGEWSAQAITDYIPVSTSIANGVVSFENGNGETLFTLTLPVYNGGVS